MIKMFVQGGRGKPQGGRQGGAYRPTCRRRWGSTKPSMIEGAVWEPAGGIWELDRATEWWVLQPCGGTESRYADTTHPNFGHNIRPSPSLVYPLD